MAEDVLEVWVDAYSTRHTIRYSVLYSIRQNKFIKGRVDGHGEARIGYRVLEGEYLLWSVSGFTDNRGCRFEITRVKVEKQEFPLSGIIKGKLTTLETICSYETTVDELQQFADDPTAPESFKLFIDSLPHGKFGIGKVPDPTKTFDVNEAEKVCRFIGKKIRESAEF